MNGFVWSYDLKHGKADGVDFCNKIKTDLAWIHAELFKALARLGTFDEIFEINLGILPIDGSMKNGAGAAMVHYVSGRTLLLPFACCVFFL
jgi:hypothetical protein